MKSAIVFLMLIVAASVCNAQWYWQKPLPQGNHLWATDFVNASVGWVVGSHGTILKTSDGGISWIDQTSGTTLDLKCVWFLNNTTGWVVGDSGIVLKTTNSGNVWNIQRNGVNDYGLLAVHFFDTNTGWAVGGNPDINQGIILHTSNGGADWISQEPDSISLLRSVYFVDLNNGWAVGGWAMGDSTILHTTDGGNSWLSEIGPDYCFTVTFSDSQHGWIVGNDYNGWSEVSKILRTTNGGTTWDEIPYSSPPIISASFTNENTGWTIDEQSTIRKTTDGGNTWSDQPSGTLCQLMSLSLVDPSTACIVGIGGIILTTTSGGENWTTRSIGATDNNNLAVDFVDTENGWTVGFGGSDSNRLHRTSNGGVTWMSGYIDIGYPYDVDFVDANTGWIVGSEGMIIKSIDGGTNWLVQRSVTEFQILRSVYFINQNTGWAVGFGFGNGIALRTTDGGSNWLSMTLPGTPVTGEPMAVYFVDANTGWIVGSNALIFKTTNGGIGWLYQPSGLGSPYPGFSSVHFIDTNTGWIFGSGYSSIILKTSNGGMNWNVQPTTGTQFVLWSGDFTDANNGWAVGSSSGNTAILYTTNGGELWTDQISPADELHDVCFVDRNNGWAVGVFGTILHTTNGGLTFVEGERRDNVPTDFSLTQNYPNPFNPVTNFQFSIVNRQLTILKVYDVLGREVATLVNEVKQPGIYSMKWDASGVASGVYFYRLQTGSFVDIKKLILLR